MQFYTCPAGYCSCKHDSVISNSTCIYSYSHTDPDLQCACDRRGGVIICVTAAVPFEKALCTLLHLLMTVCLCLHMLNEQKNTHI